MKPSVLFAFSLRYQLVRTRGEYSFVDFHVISVVVRSMIADLFLDHHSVYLCGTMYLLMVCEFPRFSSDIIGMEMCFYFFMLLHAILPIGSVHIKSLWWFGPIFVEKTHGPAAIQYSFCTSHQWMNFSLMVCSHSHTESPPKANADINDSGRIRLSWIIDFWWRKKNPLG